MFDVSGTQTEVDHDIWFTLNNNGRFNNITSLEGGGFVISGLSKRHQAFNEA